MSWVLDEKKLEELSLSPERSEWAESGAFEGFYEVREKLSPHHQDLSRLGALGFKPITGSEGLQAWLFPIEGHPKILGTQNTIEILGRTGELLYQGIWGEVPFELVKAHVEFFLWLPYRHGGTPPRKSFTLRVLGLFRFLKNRHRKKGP